MGEKSKSVSFSRVYVCVKAKLTLVSFFYFFFAPSPNETSRPGLGEFWPEDIDVSLCDVIYYGFGNILNQTYEVCSWDPWFDMGCPVDSGEKSIKNCVVERDGDVWTPGCTIEGGLPYCEHDGIRRTLALKDRNHNLKVLFSIGGWTARGWILSELGGCGVR